MTPPLSSLSAISGVESIPARATVEWAPAHHPASGTEKNSSPQGDDLPQFSAAACPLPGLAVIVPTRNNELTIGTLVILAKSYAEHVIVVDDGSVDRTMEVAERAGAWVIDTRSYGRGRVQSILAGCRQALGYDCKAVVLINNHGEHLTREIPHIARPVLSGEADLVIGSRYLFGRKGIPPYQLDSADGTCPLSREKKVFSSTDPDSAFRAISVKGICLLDLLPDSDSFESMMVSLFSRKGLTLKEIPIMVRDELMVTDGDDLPKYKGKKIAVVVPAHNEELLIGETLRSIPDFVARVYVVNDYSTDRTQEIMEYYASHDTSIIPIRHEVNKGVGAAIATGYRKALEDGMDIAAVMAGDNQMDPAFLPELLDPIIEKKCDYTMGNRLVGQTYRSQMSRWRFFGNTMLTLLTKIASGYWSMMDPQNGYTAISKRALERININDMYPRYGYCNDLLVRLNINSFRVINVPHPARYGMETSGIRYSSYIVNLSKLLLKDFIWRMKAKYVVISFHPLVLFYLAGAVFTVLGTLLGMYSLYYKFIQGHPIFVPLTLSLIVFGFGIQALFFAMFYDMQMEKQSNGWYA
jgi:glycosyltransferase involved in cell wall biosynthesis